MSITQAADTFVFVTERIVCHAAFGSNLPGRLTDLCTVETDSAQLIAMITEKAPQNGRTEARVADDDLVISFCDANGVLVGQLVAVTEDIQDLRELLSLRLGL